MKEFNAENIINFALCGHATTGKTILTEAMVFNAGLINRMGSIEDGNTASDYHDYEIEKEHSITSTLFNVEWLEKKFNIIDTPGYLDFHGESKASLRVADFAAIVISATNGVEVGTELIWEYTQKDYSLPSIIIVNYCDRDNANFDSVLAQCQERFGNKVFPMMIPVNPGEGFNQVADIMRKELYTYQTDGSGTYQESPLSDELKAKIEGQHDELIELIAESDDELLETFFEQGELTEEQFRGGIHKAIATGGLIPVFCISSKNNIGVRRLMDVLSRYAPCAADFKDITGKKPGSDKEIHLTPSESEPMSAFVFKTISEPHVGEMSFFRVYSGTINAGTDYKNTSKGNSEKVRQIYHMNGNVRKDTNRLLAGDIGATMKLKNTNTGNTLAASYDLIELPEIIYPNPNIRMAIKPKSRGDEEKMSEGLSTFQLEDPTFHYTVDPELKQTIIAGQGELHLETITSRLKNRFNVELDLFPPKIPYRETIVTEASSKYRHKKQSGGAGQFAEVWMRIEPLERGSGLVFSNSLVGQNVDRVFVVSVEKGVNHIGKEGILAGCRVVDLKVDFYDGKMHPVDSNDISFQIAGRHAFTEAFMAAKPKLLEPIYKLKVKIPDSAMGDVMGDISQRRGRVQGMDSDGKFQIIEAEVPLATIHDYSAALRSITQGRGVFSIEFSHYENLPALESEKVIAAYKEEREKGN